MNNDLITTFHQALRDKLGNNLKELWLFGSQARGDAHEGSDYDFLVVIDGDLGLIKQIIRDEEWRMAEQFECLLASVVYPQATWNLAKNSPLGWNIQKEGMKVA